jgi:hypothetical protein
VEKQHSGTSSKVGSALSAQRKHLKYSIEFVSQQTKIKQSFLELMEAGDFGEVGQPLYARQFVKTYARFLGLDTEKVMAIYRRETSKQATNPEQRKSSETKIPKRFSTLLRVLYSRSFLVITAAVVVCLALVAYGAAQLGQLFSQPKLTIFSPVELLADFDGDIYVAGNSFKVEGETDPQTIVTYNSEVLNLEPGNIFSTPEIPLKNSESVVILTATNQFGRVSTIRLNVRKGSTGISDVNKMSVLVEVKEEVTQVLIRADGKIVFNDRAFVGDLIQIDAETILQIESPSPYNLVVTINGEPHEFTQRNKIWELIDGNLLEKEPGE